MESPTSRPVRPASKSGFSFRSHRSSGSFEGKRPRIGLTETEDERRRNKLSEKTYVNPNRAIHEDQPATRALQEASTLTPIRSYQHKDWQGNPIVDPDASNPSRPRMERPLDTIRSFEAAIDDGSRRRSQMLRAQPAGDVMQGGESRAGSVVGSDVNINPRSPAAIPGPMVGRRHSQQQGYQLGHQHDSYPRGPSSSHRRGAPQRIYTAPSWNRPYQPEHVHYPHHGYNESYDTTGDSAGSPSEPWGTSTDPSSENSSIDRIHAVKGPENDAYGGVQQYGRGSPRPYGTIAEEEMFRSGPEFDELSGSSPGFGANASPAANGVGYSLDQNYNYHHGGPPTAQQHQPRPNREPVPRQIPTQASLPRSPLTQGSAVTPSDHPGVTTSGLRNQRQAYPIPKQPQQHPQRQPQQQQQQQQQQQKHFQQRPDTLRKKSSDKPKRQSWIKRAFGRGDN